MHDSQAGLLLNVARHIVSVIGVRAAILGNSREVDGLESAGRVSMQMQRDCKISLLYLTMRDYISG
jgi:hypothetical protein